jgi:aryl-alcohol dehydrogenase-like predicted oxidoreductase
MPKRDSGRSVAALSEITAAKQRGREGSLAERGALITSEYAKRFGTRYSPDFYRPAIDGALVSSIGIGTYLGECTDQDDADYQDTIVRALGIGVNLIDTAINYRCQRSERAVGAALRRAFASGMHRDEVIVCTKGGYLPLDGEPPASRDAYRSYLKKEFFSSGVLTPDDVVSGGHSLAPSFLRYSIGRSRANLAVETIDLYYLHNPEQQLAAVSPESFRERLRAAFMVLEDAVSRGEIRAYGCATWSGLRLTPQSKGHVSLGTLLDVAREIGGEQHHFRAVQIPISLAMPEALRVPTQEIGKRRTLVPAVEAAAAYGLAVFASAPLMQAQLANNLPETVRKLFPSQRTDAQRALTFVRSIPGVTAALVGTRSAAHLAENLESAGAPAAS